VLALGADRMGLAACLGLWVLIKTGAGIAHGPALVIAQCNAFSPLVARGTAAFEWDMSNR
jgi:hypothetical protein